VRPAHQAAKPASSSFQRTGYPIVDAGMRQLAQTGWMHNRARMIAASFLVKDLLLDWRRGEHWFLQRLVDGDPASNNGGWQWCASTGTDAQPYFRIFSPTSQGERFDPQGAYVKRWIPELRDVPQRFVHRPWEMPAFAPEYPAPIVEHAQRRMLAVARFEAARAARSGS
jgi:deoxyribodipyrimidine photo-lyase